MPSTSAASLPVVQVSANTHGPIRSSRWTCRSVIPGSSHSPPASITSAAAGSARASPTSAIRPSSKRTSTRAGPSGRHTVPPLMRVAWDMPSS